MEVYSQISRQRVKHIVSSYCLDGTEAESFSHDLDELLKRYPMPAVELALVEVLAENWGKPCPVRGILFLEQVCQLLREWKEASSVAVRVTPSQFQHITGLDPSPIFGPAPHTLPLSCESSFVDPSIDQPRDQSVCG